MSNPPERNVEFHISGEKAAEIKMQMAKDILVAQMIDPTRSGSLDVNDDLMARVCDVSEWIFNRFNK